MKRYKHIAFVLILFMLLIPQASFAFEGFSGSMWGSLRYDTLQQNPKALGFIRQGIDWLYIKEARFSTYGEFRYRYSDLVSEFTNAYAPVLGFSLKKDPFIMGWEYSWETSTDVGPNINRSEFYLEWYSDWDLKPLLR